VSDNPKQSFVFRKATSSPSSAPEGKKPNIAVFPMVKDEEQTYLATTIRILDSDREFVAADGRKFQFKCGDAFPLIANGNICVRWSWNSEDATGKVTKTTRLTSADGDAQFGSRRKTHGLTNQQFYEHNRDWSHGFLPSEFIEQDHIIVNIGGEPVKMMNPEGPAYALLNAAAHNAPEFMRVESGITGSQMQGRTGSTAQPVAMPMAASTPATGVDISQVPA
jgi:hypothetical protein